MRCFYFLICVNPTHTDTLLSYNLRISRNYLAVSLDAYLLAIIVFVGEKAERVKLFVCGA